MFNVLILNYIAARYCMTSFEVVGTTRRIPDLPQVFIRPPLSCSATYSENLRVVRSTTLEVLWQKVFPRNNAHNFVVVIHHHEMTEPKCPEHHVGPMC